MGALDDEIERLTRANRPLRMSETLHVDLPHQVELSIPPDQRHVWREVREWCEDHVRELWTAYPRHRSEQHVCVLYKFTGAHDAMMFKLTWGGRAPPKPYLP